MNRQVWSVSMLALLLLLPILAVCVLAILPDKGTLVHLAQTRLSDYVLNAVLLLLGVGALSLTIGTYAAWYVTMYEFPFRRVLEWMLLLPLAIPSYVLAITYGHQLDVAGPVQSTLRDWFGLVYGDYWFPDIRSLGGAVLVLSFALYPYVYILARTAFSCQCRSLFESSTLLGLPQRKWLRQIALPVARPALVVGAALVIMETLADFGVVSLFGVDSFTTGIYRAWYGMGDPIAAAKLSAILMVFVFGAIALERYSRRHVDYNAQIGSGQSFQRMKTTKCNGIYRAAACAIPVLIGFVIPIIQLCYWAQLSSHWLDAKHINALGYSLMIAGLTALIAMSFALLFAYYLRRRPNKRTAALIRLASMGYAIPGSVIAVGVFIPLLWLDRTVIDLFEYWTGERMGLLLTGSIAAIVMACTVRFMAVALGNVESGLKLIPTQQDDAANMMGAGRLTVFRQLHLPYLKVSLLIGCFIVFADTLKELPASLLLRPFNVDTLAIRTYELASDGRLVDASIPALMMVTISLVAVFVLAYQQRDRVEQGIDADALEDVKALMV